MANAAIRSPLPTHSRYLIRCQIVSRMDLSQVRAICEAAMREYGVPARIRTDNGAPFAGTGLLGLSKLPLGWMKLGIVHARIQAGRPQQNGRHRTLVRGGTRLISDLFQREASDHRGQEGGSRNQRVEQNGFVDGMGAFPYRSHSVQRRDSQGRSKVAI